MACGNNMVSRAGLQSAPVSIAMPVGPGPARPQPTIQQVAAVQQQTRAAMDQAERRAVSATTPAAALDAVKDAQRVLDAARRMRGPASASTIRELERGFDRVKGIAAAAADASAQADRAADRSRRENEFAARFRTEARLGAATLGVPAHRSMHASAPQAPPDAPKSPEPSGGSPVTAQSPLQTVHLDASQRIDPLGLASNTAYESNGYVWETDSMGHVSHVEGDLHLETAERHTALQAEIGRRGDGHDDGGHLIGSRFGGLGSGPNVVPQARDLNRSWGQWYKMEATWAEQLAKGNHVHVSIDLVGDPERPTEYFVQYTIEDESYEIGFVNENFRVET